ncbi:ATP phosphoribosyltransferase regulatory subunit [Neisseria sp. ZJ106]|uniref:ATP phosphoribosyltransferase regulatory subunit n=1 Tax=Neisseria lisongii TaxID=2912188 RepID=A0AAW5AFG5_9NEIS|nr:ATP phosphoribosyltransferase regulatory subunit [Neisseria lisongii]MCF7521287.1 ATP phosphoribosyltransferase regulatory subunit [Neisseria lisongii]MCF7528688.1 ATP phosphoribosyltransferase regulatory subunit [Neisseria lisongii]MCF7529546.1 ATP phosphoribosyltransferase regulatory subunit [Neisseria lisongii]WCL72092.1 ATP phosphoribosyltransferase regulatory subunit [Neisseria lisongii]
MQSWQLPEHIADILPTTARQLESAREKLLALFRVHGYELVQPPLMEYSNSLLTYIDAGLSLKTIRVVDQLSGRQLGIRADITPQVARIDAHLLSANNGINRLCYAGSVLHARPDGLLSTREPLQIGAELYGHADVAADIELIDLMLKSMAVADIGEVLLSLGHIGVFRALAEAAKLNEQQSLQLLSLMQDKDADAVAEQVRVWQLDGMWAKALTLLPSLYGSREVLAEARAKLPELSAVSKALDELEAVCNAFAEQAVHIDLSELRVDNYHTGLLYAAYGKDCHDAVARGGRYDGLGAHFGRSRPATGFSFDLRTFIGRLPAIERLPVVMVAQQDAEAAAEAVEKLRAAGQSVIIDYGVEHNGSKEVAGRLKNADGVWQVVQD